MREDLPDRPRRQCPRTAQQPLLSRRTESAGSQARFSSSQKHGEPCSQQQEGPRKAQVRPRWAPGEGSVGWGYRLHLGSVAKASKVTFHLKSSERKILCREEVTHPQVWLDVTQDNIHLENKGLGRQGRVGAAIHLRCGQGLARPRPTASSRTGSLSQHSGCHTGVGDGVAGQQLLAEKETLQ